MLASNATVPESIQDKTALLHEHGIALWVCRKALTPAGKTENSARSSTTSLFSNTPLHSK